MKYYLLYIVALWLLARAVGGMITDAEDQAYKDVEKLETLAWTKGFKRGALSASPDKTEDVLRPS